MHSGSGAGSQYNAVHSGSGAGSQYNAVHSGLGAGSQYNAAHSGLGAGSQYNAVQWYTLCCVILLRSLLNICTLQRMQNNVRE